MEEYHNLCDLCCSPHVPLSSLRSMTPMPVDMRFLFLPPKSAAKPQTHSTVWRRPPICLASLLYAIQSLRICKSKHLTQIILPVIINCIKLFSRYDILYIITVLP